MRKKYYIRSAAFTVNTRICIGDLSTQTIQERKGDIYSILSERN